MGLLLLKKFSLLFLLISASLLSTSLAGQRMSKCGNYKFVDEDDSTCEEMPTQEEEVNVIHERLLKADTKDYGIYDPPPTLVKPPFKHIPN